MLAIRPRADQVAHPGERITVEQRESDDLIEISQERTLPERVHLLEAHRVTRDEVIALTVDDARWTHARLGELLGSALGEALDRLHRCIVHDARDWGATRRDALTWAIVVGWGDAWAEMARRYSWSDDDVTDLKRLHVAVDDAKVLHRDR